MKTYDWSHATNMAKGFPTEPEAQLQSDPHANRMSTPPTPTGTEAAVCADIARRQQLGLAKYGTTVAANPLAQRAWLQHAYEECLDQAIYLRRSIDEPAPCAWHDDHDGVWHTACGNSHVFLDGTPHENRYRHCPYCGHQVVARASYQQSGPYPSARR